jgi:hypothetical protein
MKPAGTPRLFGAFGAQGCGKTAWGLQLLARLQPSRLIVWDFKHDPRLSGTGRNVATIPDLLAAMKSTRFALRYLVDHDHDVKLQFRFFCMAAWEAGNVFVVVDELPEVTAPGRAPPAWRKIINVGRDYVGQDGKRKTIAVLGMAQRSAEVDKSFISNLDVLHVGRMGEANDARELAGKVLAVDWRELTMLPNLHWIERRAGQAAPLRGILTFK